MKRQLSTKFEECILKNDAATPLTISNFSRAWQAYFWSYTLQILCENTTFIDVQMMCSDDFDISSGFRFEKIWLSCTVHTYSLYLSKPKYCSEFFRIALTGKSPPRGDIIFTKILFFVSTICYFKHKIILYQDCFKSFATHF